VEPEVQLRDIETPPSRGGLFSGPMLSAVAAKIAVRALDKPLRFGAVAIAVRHCDVVDMLSRDLDFRIAPENAARIDEVNGPFILGMDRSDRLCVERHALYSALSEIDLPALVSLAARDAEDLIAGAGGGPIDAVSGYARPVAARTAQRLFGVKGSDEATFLAVARAIFAHTFLNFSGDKAVEARAVKAAVLLRAWLATEIERRRAAHATGDDLMGALMRQPDLNDDGVRRTLGGLLVGAIDTTATAVVKILVVMSRDARLAATVRRDALSQRLTLGWCREALRRWPHNPVVLRKAVTDTTLGGVAIPAGSQVFAWTQAAMQDAHAFPAPEQMQPDRPDDGYLHFGGGLHPCAGRAINNLQIPMLVSKLALRGFGKVGPVSWAGPFPAHLPVQLERL